MPQTFKFFVPFTKAYVDKATNKMMVEGLASTTEVDLTGEKMAESAIKSMAQSNLPLSFRSEHKADWDAELGQVVELSATPDHQLLMKAELDADHPNAHFLFGKLQTGSRLGLSIGGQVKDWGWEHDEQVGRSIRTYKDIALQEVSVTSHPAVASTFLAAINKSLATAEDPMTKHDNAADVATPTLEPADDVLVNQTPETPSGDPVANPLPAVAGEPVATTGEGLPLNPHQDAPADQPAAAPEVPSTPGNHADGEQAQEVEKDEDGEKAEQAPAAPSGGEPHQDTTAQPTAQPQPETPTGDAGHQEASSTEETQPDAATTEKAVTKAQYLSEWAEADATELLIAQVSDDLSWTVWGTIIDETLDAPAKTAKVDAILGEFHDIVLRVATTLIEHQAASNPEATKALQAKRVEIVKSLDTATDDLASVTKRLEEQTAATETAQAEKAALEGELATTRETLAETETALKAATAEAEKFQARKARVIAEKFDLAIAHSNKEPKDMNKAFAAFFAGGK
jgi:HK97 family phage prohead protease